MKNKLIPILALGVLCLLGVAATNVTVLWFSQAPHATLAGTDILLLERPSPHTNMNFTVAELKTYANNGMSSTADLNGASNVLRTAQIQSTNDLNTTFTSRLNTTSNILLNASNLLGKVQTANLGYSGTANSSTFLRGDNTWQTPAGVGDVTQVGQNNFTASNHFNGATAFDGPVSFAGTVVMSNNLSVPGTMSIGTLVVTNPPYFNLSNATNAAGQTVAQMLNTNQNWVHQFGSANLTNWSTVTTNNTVGMAHTNNVYGVPTAGTVATAGVDGGIWWSNAATSSVTNILSPSGYFVVPWKKGLHVLQDEFYGYTTTFNLNWGIDGNASGTVTAVAPLDQAHMGLAKFHLATLSTTTRVGAILNASYNSTSFGGGDHYMECAVKFNETANGTNKWKVGFLDERVDNFLTTHREVAFSYEVTNSANWVAVCATNNSTGRTTSDTTSAVDTSWHILGIHIAANAGSAEFYIDGTLKSTINGYIPYTTGMFVTPVIAGTAFGLGTGADNDLYLDYFWYCFAPTAFP